MKKVLLLLVLCLGFTFVTASAEEEKALTRSDFCTQMYTIVKYMDSFGELEITQSFDDCDAKAVNLLLTAGIVNGVGDNKINPDEIITREEATAIFGRLCKSINFPANLSEYEYADHDEISKWAIDDVYAAYHCGVELGTEGDNFVPKATVTASSVDKNTIWLYVMYTGNEYPPVSDN